MTSHLVFVSVSVAWLASGAAGAGQHPTARSVLTIQSVESTQASNQTNGGRTPTARLMRQKLAHAHRILDALTTSDYSMLDRESTALSRVAESPLWESLLKTPEFKGYGDAFRKVAGDLAAAGRQRDLDAAATLYGTLTMSCYNCHRHVKGSRIARRPEVALRPIVAET
jgi:cytochrome c556